MNFINHADSHIYYRRDFTHRPSWMLKHVETNPLFLSGKDLWFPIILSCGTLIWPLNLRIVADSGGVFFVICWPTLANRKIIVAFESRSHHVSPKVDGFSSFPRVFPIRNGPIVIIVDTCFLVGKAMLTMSFCSTLRGRKGQETWKVRI